MTTPLEVLQLALDTELVDRDGQEFELDLLPPLTEEELATFEASLPCPLPESIRELLELASGFEGGFADTVDFAGRFAFAMEAFPHGLPIASDGAGNFWVADLSAQSTEFGPIYFACHDPPIIAYQSASLSEFLGELLDPSTDVGAVETVYEEGAMKIWKEDPDALPKGKALASSDATLRGFALNVPDGFLIVDLRNAPVGAGFSWGRFGADTRVLRHGTEPLFAYGPR
jgi:cell wall assembly regulator SMI1